MTKPEAQPYTLEMARPLLQEATDTISDLIAQIRHEEGCLPLFELRVPATTDDLDALILSLGANLFDHGGDSSAAWLTAFSGACGHLPPAQIREAYEVYYRWYTVLDDLTKHLECPYAMTWTNWPTAASYHDFPLPFTTALAKLRTSLVCAPPQFIPTVDHQNGGVVVSLASHRRDGQASGTAPAPSMVTITTGQPAPVAVPAAVGNLLDHLASEGILLGDEHWNGGAVTNAVSAFLKSHGLYV